MRSTRAMNFAVITVSDRAFRGEYPDRGGPAAVEYLKSRIESDEPFKVHARVVPDSANELEFAVEELSKALQCCLILTTGGTGISARDITPQTTEKLCEGWVIPGFGEAMRRTSLDLGVKTAIVSRAIAAVYDHRTLIINLPGSPNAIGECMDAVIDVIPHAINHIQPGIRLRINTDKNARQKGLDPALHHAELKKKE